MDMSHPDYDNDLVAAGAILMLLLVAQEQRRALTSVHAVANAEGEPTNQLELTFKFLASPYRLTVERVTEETP